MPKYFPLFTDIENCHVLIAGGGKAALTKIRKLLPFKPRMTVAALDFLPEIANINCIDILRISGSEIEKLICKVLPRAVIVADTEIVDASKIYELCQKNRIPVNTVDRQDLCTFIFPATINRGSLTVAVSTSGASPAAAVKIRESVEEILPTEVDSILDWLSSLRSVLRYREDINTAMHRSLFRILTDSAFEKNRPLYEDETEAIIERIKNER